MMNPTTPNDPFTPPKLASDIVNKKTKLMSCCTRACLKGFVRPDRAFEDLTRFDNSF